MEIVRRVHAMREVSRQARAKGHKIGFVPTMGSLHDGHLSLVRRVKEVCDVVVVSVFVNPTQFGPRDDFERYPRDLTRDADLCIAEGVDYVFAPEAEEIYPRGACTFVETEGLGTVLEGEFDEVIDVVRQCFDALAADCNRIECSVKLDYRKGRCGGLETKLASVEQKLGHPLRR